MRITRLQAENFKRLVAVDITPEGNVQLIAGANAQGKSSVLDAIAYALAGSKAGKLDRPVRDGADGATVSLDLGEYVVTRRWNPGGRSVLEVKLPNGTAVPSPQKLLDSIIGKLSFDPLAFVKAEPKDQRRMLLEVAGLVEDDNNLRRQETERFDLRTEINRDAKKARAAVESSVKPGLIDSDTSTVDTAALFREVTVLRADQTEFDRLLAGVRSIDEELAELSRRREELVGTRTDMADRGRRLNDPGRAEKIAETERRIASADDINRQVADAQRYRALEAEAKDQEAQARKLTEEIEEIRRHRAEAVQGAALPIDGLTVDDEGVLFNGVPFTQSSAAEKMRVSLAMAMAMNPELRVLRLEDASLLDSVSRAMVEQAAAEHDFQVWLEVVDETKGVGIVIEDGQVVEHG